MIAKKLVMLLLVTEIAVSAITIDRVILGCDTNPLYVEFWPLVAKTWKEIVGVKPTLALIAPKDFYIDETLGDVIRFEPIPDIPTAFQAQVIRLLLPAYFENEVCIISDMDMIPLQKDYFVNAVANVPRDSFVVYKDGAFDADQFKEYPMCYNVALGKTFKEIFNVLDLEQIPLFIMKWYALGLGWTSDQQILYQSLNNWKNKTDRLIKLAHDVHPRVDRLYWRYNKKKLAQKNYYIDCHMLRPYSEYKDEIDDLMSRLFRNESIVLYNTLALQEITRAPVQEVKAAMSYLDSLEVAFDDDWQKYHAILPRIINHFNLRVGCEIGVSFGSHCKKILQTTNVQKLYGIDPYLNYGDPTNTAMPNLYFDIFHYKVKDKLSRFGDRFLLMRDFSLSAAALFADASLDFIFLDANHTFQAVTDDLNAWYSKVRAGGIIAGDDYATCYPGVPMAVNTFFQNKGIPIYLDKDQPRFWWIIKP